MTNTTWLHVYHNTFKLVVKCVQFHWLPWLPRAPLGATPALTEIDVSTVRTRDRDVTRITVAQQVNQVDQGIQLLTQCVVVLLDSLHAAVPQQYSAVVIYPQL